MKRRLKETVRECPVCLNRTGEILHHQRFKLPEKYSLPDSYDVVACTGCGFVYADTSATQTDYNRYYRELSKYEDATMSSGGGSTALDARRLKRSAREIAKYVPDLKARIVDIGCANGGLLIELKKLGYGNCSGIDPSKKCVSYVNGRGIKALRGGLFSGPAVYGEAKYDCIILSHVMEHIYDLRRGVRKIHKNLSDGGMVYVEVPDASAYSKNFIIPYYFFDCEHINHFDLNSLKNLFLSSGLVFAGSSKKTIQVSKSTKYPAVYAVFKKTDKSSRGLTMGTDARQNVIDYVRLSREAGSLIELDEIRKKKIDLVVWGAGSHTLRLLGTTKLDKCKISSFIDNDSNKHGKMLKGVTISPPHTLVGHEGPIAVCSALHSKEIISQIRKMGLKNRVIVL